LPPHLLPPRGCDTGVKCVLCALYCAALGINSLYTIWMRIHRPRKLQRVAFDIAMNSNFILFQAT